ncbi:translocation/assembly module TamB [Bdellovibrio bacteriovorus]|uniref:translocation/assembly module TamB n=1 Tax=Bdellovibrio bacteriovorus TaxID=959 RepID=UPI00045BEAAA|nr:translocation/assembly module TamB [Bdellovibrio bacteriovorus]AHZ85003.1 hypothetical protein EP01_08630 [Bdellovibrio bacteriovorus]BEV68890.1 hypothetical protein Bb109J_c2310 [Bdellovibrio bacteriovorus]
MRRAFWILLTPLACFLVLWAVGSTYIAPKLETWALNKIQSYSDENLPVSIRAKKLSLRFLRPSAAIEGIEIRGKGELADSLPLIEIGSVRAFVDVFHLMGGRLTLSAVVAESPRAQINIDPFLKDDSPAKELPMDEIFAILEKLPLQRVFLQNILLNVSSKQLKLNVDVESGDLLLTNMGKNLTAKANIPSLQVKLGGIGDFAGSLDTHLYLTRQSLKIIQLGVRLGESEILTRGELTHFSKIAIKPSGVLDLSAKVNLTDIYNEVKRLRPDIKLPVINGELVTEMDARFNGLEDVKASADINTRSVTLGKLELGDARVQGEYQNGVISLSEMQVNHPAGEATLTKSQLELDGNYGFKSLITVHSLDLYKLFQSLDLANIPVGIGLEGELPCEGRIRPTFQVTCTNASISGKDLWVKTDLKPNTKPLVNIDSMKAKGQFQVTTQSVTYAALLNVGSSQGTTDGVIDFNKGFKINFKTDKLDLKNIRNLANLKMIGAASISGSTSGDSNAAIFDMKLNARNFIFEDFALGNLIADLKYRKGHLIFEDIAGAINKTQYLGDLNVNLNNETLSGDFSVPTADIADVAQVFEPIYKLPIQVQGVGAAKAHVEGPLNFWKLNYKIESAFKKVFIGLESFDSLQFNASANQGNIKADKVVLQRANSTVTLQGGISSDKIMNLYADGKNWRLEESDIISKINSNITGNLNFAAELKESVTQPQILLKGAITDTLFEDQEIPNSNLILKISRQSVAGQMTLFGNKVKADFQVPIASSRTPLVMKVTTNNWNYSTLLGLIGGANLANEYDSALTSTVDLRSDSGELFKATGKVHIDAFTLKRGPLSFANNGPIDITMDHGVASIRNFTLQGPNNLIQIRGTNFTAENLNVGVTANADLRLLQIFTPFLEDMGGPIHVSTNVSGSVMKPEILGNANAKDTFVKIKGFPHPLEKVSAEVVFSQSRILINSINGQIAGGTLTGDGGIQINGIKDIPTTIRARLEGVTFNVPDKVRSSGSADLLFSGRWFPFTLSGTYHVTSAMVEKEFTEDGGGVTGVRQSLYLPKLLREGQFEAILLDLQILLSRNIVIKNSLIDGSVTGQLQVKGPPTNPVLLGKISMERRSKIIFKDKVFDVQSGVIDFNDPDEINPNLYISAASRINEYDITLLAQGPSKNPTILLNSVPPLSEQDIISLIALGVTSSAMDQNLQSRQQAEQLGVEIGGAVLAKPINKQLESTLGLNLAVTSQYDSTRNISVPKITLSRRLSEKMKVSGSRPVGDTQSYDIKLEYILNSNFTAIGSFETRGTEENTNVQSTQQESQSIFGLDLEFKREFK